MRPTIVQEIRTSKGEVKFAHHPAELNRIPLSDDAMALLRSAMTGVVDDPDGTGKKCRIEGLEVAGKTGTSQVIRHRERTNDQEDVPYHERAHAIFVAFVDTMPRKLALAVIVEHGGSGGTTAAPMARRIICRYYGIPDPGEAAK